MSKADATLVAELRAIVGRRHVLTEAAKTLYYRRGYRFGSGACLAVARPASLVEMWRVLQASIAADATIIMQAANTGLTGGSTPDGTDYAGPVLIISTGRIKGIFAISHGAQAVCLAGATLYELERALAPLGRAPHSVIGSSCIGASVIGGVCNNSGGALLRRGPAFTEMALYARVDEGGRLVLVNRLGIALGYEPMEMLARLDRGDFGNAEIGDGAGLRCSDHDYAAHVRDIDAPTPARYNADPKRLAGVAGSAGKVATFAVRLDTFPLEAGARTFYLGFNDAAELEELRRHVLRDFKVLPICGEYIHREAFAIAERYGKDTYLAIQHFGTRWLPPLFRWKNVVDRLAARLLLPRNLGDRLLQAASRLFPAHLPPRIREFGDHYAHHLIMTVAADGLDEARTHLAGAFPSKTGAFFECNADEAAAAFRHRFAVAGAAVRYRALHPDTVADIVALDIALRRNDRDWFETLPPALDAQVVHKLYYGHFFCHVLHQDYVLCAGSDPLDFEHALCRLLDARGAEYPAEHNVGHLYPAKPALAEFYRTLDPTNRFNPGIGKTSRRRDWADTVT